MTSLLPLNSTPLERAIEVATDEVTQIPLRTLYNPQTCPAHLLYHLAWAWSVDRWDDEWSEPVKRAAIAASFFIHARKGTIGAIRRVVEPLGYLIDVLEWWETVPQGIPGTFSLKVGVLDTGITEEMYQELTALIDDAKPVSRHMRELAISLETTGRFYMALSVSEGDEIDVYPPVQRDIDVTGFVGLGGRETTIDTLDVFA
ncbi:MULTISPECIES: phage tail protein I [Pseudomonas syringae group]|uniref:Tail protein I n=4 Tax=Pseudomonas syringae group TaxID=136849 RepID=A0A2K4WX85_PSESX|nr:MULTISPECIES: phage tail protein I [Pseudomonas syringae group]KPB84464.1 Tail protein I [Pseudomonas syringae pv. maculicola]AVB14255.1 phage tail protein I [Pseudomonas amygdali pv. morsprunorum]EPM53852.1 tail protein I [Pseudomonas syringae pv. actinidiae ICMP 19071]EPM74319.1 tail protein I [Pseudomonas syringae pv. actinidiae ICMP 19072]KPX79131.1 Tail protein I [Pseudomonas amygdali pv. photiniae]